MSEPTDTSAPAVLDWLETELKGIVNEPVYLVPNRADRRAQARRVRAERVTSSASPGHRKNGGVTHDR